MPYSSGRMLLNSQGEGQVSSFRLWVLIAIPLAAILFQVSVAPMFQFLSFVEMPLLVVVYFSLMRRNQVSGLLFGAIVGLMQDSLSKNYLGTFGMVKTLVGYTAASMGMRIDAEHALVRLLLSFFFYIFHQFFYWVVVQALLGRPMDFEIPKTLMLALLNAVVGVALFHFLDKLRDNS